MQQEFLSWGPRTSGPYKPSEMVRLLFWEACSIHSDFQRVLWLGSDESHHCPMSPTKPNCAQSGLLLSQSPRFLKASLTSLGSSLSRSKRPATSLQWCTFRFCHWCEFLPMNASLLLTLLPYMTHRTLGSAWGGGNRVHFGQKPQHWHIPCIPFLTYSPPGHFELIWGLEGEGTANMTLPTRLTAHNRVRPPPLSPGNTFLCMNIKSKLAFLAATWWCQF